MHISGSVGAIEFSGELLTNVNEQDIIVSHNNKNIIYSLDGELITKEFSFNSIPEDLMIVSSDGGLVDISTPSGYGLNEAYPNPFNPSTSISFSMPFESYVSIKIYDTVT